MSLIISLCDVLNYSVFLYSLRLLFSLKSVFQLFKLEFGLILKSFRLGPSATEEVTCTVETPGHVLLYGKVCSNKEYGRVMSCSRTLLHCSLVCLFFNVLEWVVYQMISLFMHI